MAINDQPIEFQYIADGKTTLFPFLCRVIYESDLIVRVNNVDVSNYVIQGLNNPEGGNVVFEQPPAEGNIVLIARVIKLVRDTEYQQNGDFLAPTVNNDFDRIWMALQGTSGQFDRTLSYPLGGQHYDAENDRRIEHLADPVNDQDAATKMYTDTRDNRLESIINELSGNIIQDWIIVESFQKGASITLKNQILLNEIDKKYYRWGGDYPKEVPPNSTPETTGGFGENAWLLVALDNTAYLPLAGGEILGDLTVDGKFTAKSDAVFEKPLTANDAVKIDNTLSVTGESVFDAIITAKKGLLSNESITVLNDTAAAINLEKTEDGTGYTMRQVGLDLFIYASKNGIPDTDYIAKYSKETNTWDFNVNVSNKGNKLVFESDFHNDFTPNPTYPYVGTGVIYLPGGYMLQHIFSLDKTTAKLLWPVPFTEFVSATTAGNMDGGSEVSDWNITIGLDGISRLRPNRWSQCSSIGIGK